MKALYTTSQVDDRIAQNNNKVLQRYDLNFKNVITYIAV